MEERRAEVPSLRVEAIVICRSGEVDGAVGRMEREKKKEEREEKKRGYQEKRKGGQGTGPSPSNHSTPLPPG